MRSSASSADGRLVAGVTLGILLLAVFIIALMVTGVLSGDGSGSGDIAIAGDTQTLEPDPDADVVADDAVTEAQSPEPADTGSSASSVPYALGDTGDGIRELQARLRQIEWYQTDVTGEFDDVTFQAVEGFQAKRGLEPTGEVDEATWDQLVEMTSTPTEDEMHNRLEAGPTILGPDDEGADVSELQARLKQIGWFDHEVTGVYGPITAAAVEGFQTKRGIASTGEVDQNTWDTLMEMTRDPTSAESASDPPESPATASGLPEQCVSGRVLCVDREELVLRWVVEGEVQMTLDVRFGTEPAVREGEFEVDRKREEFGWPFFDTDMRYALFFDTGQAVHYSPDSAAEGSVKVMDEDAMKQLFDEVERHDTVFVYRS